MTARYPLPPANPDFPEIERSILDFWREEKVFERSVEHPPVGADGAKEDFVFYDGPPFANGLPHYGHLLTGYVKDLVARYQTMKGHRVERRFGWDCHGLPAELAAEKELGISGRQAITEFGIEKFNEHCRTSVMRYTHEWERYVGRQARWVDFEHDYKTMDADFMESTLWAFKQLYDKGYVYESHRVMPYSWAAETPLSNFETRLDNAYRERTDKAVTVAFELNGSFVGAPKANRYFVLAWTTTPWTLPSNLALAMSSKMGYLPLLGKDGNCYVVAQSCYGAYEKSLPAHEPLANWVTGMSEEEKAALHTTPSLSGNKFIGLTYKPLFPYFAHHPDAFRILDGTDFIEAGSGTGTVHMAPGFGEDDQRVCEAAGINLVCPVDSAGRFTDEIYDLPDLRLRGLNVVADMRLEESDRANHIAEKDVSAYGLAIMRIARWLKAHGHLIKDEPYPHSYPHCWRTDTPLIYRAMPSWYVEVTKFKDRMVELNQQINWIPGHVKDGMFGKWLEGARDWSISRNRFWGCPIPVWRSDNPHNREPYVFGSRAELEKFFGVEVPDFHRPFIDTLTAPDPTDANYTLRRVEDVFDCWFESGSMPYAQLHYPFENKEKFEANYPADFIVEYTAQTRGWFYTLMVLGTALFDKPPFLNCICHGVVVDEDGEKLSKRKGNYPDPLTVFDQYGSDALRWFMMSSAILRGQELQIDPEGAFIRDAVRLYIKPLWSAYNFFCLYAGADGVSAKLAATSPNEMDRYILAKLRVMVEEARGGLDAYDPPASCAAITAFLETLNNWYVRRNRVRFWKGELDADKQAAYDTLYTVLHTVCRAAAPLLPLVAESIFTGLTQGGELTAEGSVHLQSYPSPDELGLRDEAGLLAAMDHVRALCNAGLAIRNAENIRTRQPLRRLTVYGKSDLKPDSDFAEWMKDELNVKEIVVESGFGEVASHKLKIHFPVAGKRLGPKMKAIGAAAKTGDWTLENGTLTVAGEPMQPDEYELLLEAKDQRGSQPLASQDALVVLDLALDESLLAEGVARDAVRLIQQTRKDGGFDVSDRIRLIIEADADTASALEANRDYIAEQVLATGGLTLDALKEGAATHDLGGRPVSIRIEKVAA